MKPLVRPGRRDAAAGRLLGFLALALAAPAWAQVPLAGGARTPPEWPRALSTALPRAWSASMSRQDVRLGGIDARHDDAYTYRLPYGEGVSYAIIQGYGAKLSHVGAEQFTLDF